MKTIFDFGMYDGSDSEYFLEEGFKVVAVEANPSLCARAKAKFARKLESGQFAIVNAALSTTNDPVELTICGDDLGSSSILTDAVVQRTPLGKWTVEGITVPELIEKFGVPYYLKIDLEGVDGVCVRALGPSTRPAFLSFEAGDETVELVQHLSSIGYTQFKLINQCNFLELANQTSLRERLQTKLFRLCGYMDPHYVKRGNRWFKTRHSSGPAPWCSDGRWWSKDQLIERWSAANHAGKPWGWYDVHAAGPQDEAN